MAVTDVTSSTTTTATSSVNNPSSALGKDDFLKLLLTEMQYQDPTQPMDTDKILSQTSQLATLESADNTNKALEALSASLKALKISQQYQQSERSPILEMILSQQKEMGLLLIFLSIFHQMLQAVQLP